MDYGIFSLIPIVICFSLILIIKNPFISILSGIASALIIIFVGENIFVGGDMLFTLVTNVSSMKTTLFILLVGAIISATDKSGGVDGLIKYLQNKNVKTDSKLVAQLSAMLIGTLMFVDGTSSMAITAVVGKPLFKSAKIPTEKLALITNSTASPIAWIIPFGGAAALTTGLLATIENLEGNEFSYVVSAIPFQFYTLALFLFLLITIIFNFEIGPVKKIKYEEKKHEDEKKKQIKDNAKARNMIAPLIVLVSGIFIILFVTGSGNIMMGDGASAVFYSALITLAIALLYYKVQNFTFKEVFTWYFEGFKKTFAVTLLLFIAYIFSDSLARVGTAVFLLNLFEVVSIQFLPIMIFLLASIISFSTGTSGGTTAIIVPLAIPMAILGGGNIALTLGAIISGAVFGDQNSVISDSVIFTSSMTGVDAVKHVKTQLPYTLVALAIAGLLYLILGFI